MRSKTPLLAVLAGLSLSLLRVGPAWADDPPRQDPDRPVTCFTDERGVRWRGQCTAAERGQPARCVIAPDRELDRRGRRSHALERARPCNTDPTFDLAAMRRQGYAIVAGVADAPRGWERDARGRVYQVSFDLRRRLYAGVGWAPRLRGPTGEAAGRTVFEVGVLEIEGNTGDEETGFRHRLSIAEGAVALAPFDAEATLLRYDVSRRRSEPLFRITTFVGAPRRFDVDAQIGAWLEAGRVTIGDVAPGRRETLWRPASLHLTWDLWRSREMDAYVRLRSGLGYEVAEEDERAARHALTWAGAAEADLTLGPRGFTRLTAQAGVERPYGVVDDRWRSAGTRLAGQVGVERILIAFNDQPISLRLAGEAARRDDVPDVEARWDVRAIAGLRVSLWAPPR